MNLTILYFLVTLSIFRRLMSVMALAISLGNILFNGFSFKLSAHDRKLVKVTFNDFQPINRWEIISDDGAQPYLKDALCDYEFEEKSKARLKSLGFSIITPIFQGIGLSLNLVNRIVKVASFSHLWLSSPLPITFRARLVEMGKDLLRIVTTAFVYLALIFISFYGILRPYDGRKLYATFERAVYGGGAETFQTERHMPVRSLLSDKFHPWR